MKSPSHSIDLHTTCDTPQCAISFSGATDNLSVIGNIHNFSLPFLVDTGAAITGISQNLWDKFPALAKGTPAQPLINSVKSVSGQSLTVTGVATVPFEIDGKIYSHQANIIKGVTYDVILGKDFLHRFQSVINLKDSTLELSLDTPAVTKREEDPPPHTFEDITDICTVQSARTYTLPPHSETIFPATLDNHALIGKTGLTEPRRSLAEQYGICGAAELVCVSGTATIPIRLFNPSSTSVKIFRRTNLGSFLRMDNPDVAATFQETTAEAKNTHINTSSPKEELFDLSHTELTTRRDDCYSS